VAPVVITISMAVAIAISMAVAISISVAIAVPVAPITAVIPIAPHGGGGLIVAAPRVAERAARRDIRVLLAAITVVAAAAPLRIGVNVAGEVGRDVCVMIRRRRRVMIMLRMTRVPRNGRPRRWHRVIGIRKARRRARSWRPGSRAVTRWSWNVTVPIVASPKVTIIIATRRRMLRSVMRRIIASSRRRRSIGIAVRVSWRIASRRRRMILIRRRVVRAALMGLGVAGRSAEGFRRGASVVRRVRGTSW